MSDTASRNRKRDGAARLGKLQTRVSQWLDTNVGQVVLVGMALVLVLLASLITP